MYVYIREKNRIKFIVIISLKGYLYIFMGDWYFCIILSLCYNFVEFFVFFIILFYIKLIDIWK